ncbi:MAG: DUF4363 family protein [Eubacterium sp.]|nr:DUF4363 family protein [Eubacterium sp.]
MKRVWFAAAFLLLAAALCIGDQWYIRTFHSEMDKKITAAMSAAEKQDMPALEADIASVQHYWSEKNDLLFTLSNHTVPDELGARIRAMRPENSTITEELENVKAYNDVLYEDQKITFANIF